MSRRSIIAAALILLGISLQAGAFTSEESHVFSNADSVVVINENGGITAEMWDSSYIKIYAVKSAKIEKELEKVKCTFEENSKTATAKSIKIDEKEKSGNVSVDYRVMLPERGVLKSAETENGDIVIKYSAGDIKAETSNGSIKASGIAGSVDAETSNGIIKIDSETLSKAVSSNGNVTVKIKRAGSDAEISTANGSIDVRIEQVPDALFDMETSIGKIKVSGLDVQYKKNKNSRKEFSSKDGKYKIDIETSIGNISLSVQE